MPSGAIEKVDRWGSRLGVFVKKRKVALNISQSLSHSLKLSNGYLIIEAIN